MPIGAQHGVRCSTPKLIEWNTPNNTQKVEVVMKWCIPNKGGGGHVKLTQRPLGATVHSYIILQVPKILPHG